MSSKSLKNVDLEIFFNHFRTSKFFEVPAFVQSVYCFVEAP